MSHHHQVAIVQLDAIEHERLTLDEVLGSVPVREIAEVLTSEWAIGVGWQPVGQSGQDFRRQLEPNLAINFHVDTEANEVTLERIATGHFAENRTIQGQETLKESLAAHRDEYNLAFHDVLGRALVAYLPRQAEKRGYTVVSCEDNLVSQGEDTHIHTMEMQVYLEI